MSGYDWIVIGAGITGAALSYELAKRGLSVLLLEQTADLRGATRYSYGGLAFWLGKPLLLRPLSQQGIERYRCLEEELGQSIEFRELDLLMTVGLEQDPQEAQSLYADCSIPPQLIDPQQAHEIEPLLRPQGISAALWVRHGHIRPELTAQAFLRACCRLGGTHQVAQVTTLQSLESGGVEVEAGGTRYGAAQMAVCAGGLSRALLKQAGIPVRLYFTHAELLEIPASAHDLQLRALVSPALLGRAVLERQASRSEVDGLWDHPGHEPAAPILDPGAIQFQNGQIRLGQISHVHTDPQTHLPQQLSEQNLRRGVLPLLPAVADLEGEWCHCLVAFSCDQLPLVGSVPNHPNIHLFTGFSNPLVIVPVLAERFADHVTGKPDSLIPKLSPTRPSSLSQQNQQD